MKSNYFERIAEYFYHIFYITFLGQFLKQTTENQTHFSSDSGCPQSVLCPLLSFVNLGQFCLECKFCILFHPHTNTYYKYNLTTYPWSVFNNQTIEKRLLNQKYSILNGAITCLCFL